MPQEIPASQKPAQATATEQTAASPSPSRPVINASDLSGLKYFKRIRPLLESLHEVGAERAGGKRGSGANGVVHGFFGVFGF